VGFTASSLPIAENPTWAGKMGSKIKGGVGRFIEHNGQQGIIRLIGMP